MTVRELTYSALRLLKLLSQRSLFKVALIVAALASETVRIART